MLLGEPDGFVFDADVDFGLAVLGLVDEELAFGGEVGGRGWVGLGGIVHGFVFRQNGQNWNEWTE